MNLVRSQIADGGAAADIVQVARLAAGQRGDAERGASVRRVVRGNEAGEGLVGRQDLVGDRLGDRLGQSLLVVGRNAGRKFLRRQQKGVGRDDSLALSRDFLEQKAHRHEVVLHPRAKHLFGLGEHARDLMQTGDVVLVLLHRIEGNGERQVGEVQMRAVHLVHRHLIFLEAVIVDALPQRAAQNLMGKSVLLGETLGRDRLQAREIALIGCRAGS